MVEKSIQSSFITSRRGCGGEHQRKEVRWLLHTNVGKYSRDWLYAIMYKLYSTEGDMFVAQFSWRGDTTTFPRWAELS